MRFDLKHWSRVAVALNSGCRFLYSPPSGGRSRQPLGQPLRASARDRQGLDCEAEESGSGPEFHSSDVAEKSSKSARFNLERSPCLSGAFNDAPLALA
jgi:hypothetical protein